MYKLIRIIAFPDRYKFCALDISVKFITGGDILRSKKPVMYVYVPPFR